jgi:hypothetical protein
VSEQVTAENAVARLLVLESDYGPLDDLRTRVWEIHQTKTRGVPQSSTSEVQHGVKDAMLNLRAQ